MPLPSDKIVLYRTRETPNDPQSEVLLKHLVFISAQSQDGDDITWNITKLKFRSTAGDEWTHDRPGLPAWVVTHRNPENPVAAEFSAPPAMSGTADNDGSGDDLVYSTTPGSCTAGEKEMYGGRVTCMEYSYVAGSTTIAEGDEDEPAETDLEDPPS